MNFKIRFKNPTFWFNIGLAVVVPVLAYFGLTAQDMNTWGAVGHTLVLAVSNPYVLGVVAISVWNELHDPTTKGFRD